MINMISKIIMLLMICMFCVYSTAGAEKDEAWIKEQAFQTASKYADSISCETVTDSNYLITLVPWKKLDDMDDRHNAKYALIWHGDIGCMGGTGSFNPYIAIISIGMGDSFLVNPTISSPMIDFEVPTHKIDKIEKVTKDELVITAMVWGPDDAHCCPSVPVRIFLRQDKKGNWKLLKTETIKK